MDIKIEDKLPDVITIDDLTSGRINPKLIYNEIERLKIEINILRNDMALFVKALATIGPNQSQNQYYKVISQRLKTVQYSIQEYCSQYNKLLPIINLAQIKLGNEVERLPQPHANANSSNGAVTSNESRDSISTNGNKSTSTQSNNSRNDKPPTPGVNWPKNGANSSQPIVL